MGRTLKRFPMRYDQAQTETIINSILLRNDYHQTVYSTGETVWKKGTGIMTAMQFIKPEYYQGEVLLYGWVQAGLGSVGLNEMDLEGFVGVIPKQAVAKVMNQIIMAL